MQQEAIRRVKEMQKQAQSYVTIPPQDDKPPEKPNNNPTRNNHNRPNNFNRNRNFTNNRYRFSGQPNGASRPKMNSPNNNQRQPPMNNRANPNFQNMSMGNPFSQLFGSNLGAFSKFKNMFKSPGLPSSDSKDCKDDKPLSGLLNGVLKDFDIDEEKIILGILIYLLYKNGSDAKLLLALGYLML